MSIALIYINGLKIYLIGVLLTMLLIDVSPYKIGFTLVDVPSKNSLLATYSKKLGTIL